MIDSEYPNHWPSWRLGMNPILMLLLGNLWGLSQGARWILGYGAGGSSIGSLANVGDTLEMTPILAALPPTEPLPQYTILSKLIFKGESLDKIDLPIEDDAFRAVCREVEGLVAHKNFMTVIGQDDDFINALVHILHEDVVERRQLHLFKWMVKYVEYLGGFATLSVLFKLAISCNPEDSCWEEMRICLPEKYRGVKPTRWHADWAAELRRMSMVELFLLDGVTPTETGMIAAIKAGRVNVVEWHMKKGFFWTEPMRRELISFIGRHDMVGSRWTPYPPARSDATMTLLNAIKKHSIGLYYDFADTICAYGTPQILERILDLGYPVTEACFEMAAATDNMEVLNWYHLRHETITKTLRSSTSTTGIKRDNSMIEITSFAMDMAAYWGNVDAVALMSHYLRQPSRTMLNIAAYRGHVDFLRTFYQPNRIFWPRLSWKWALRGGHEDVLLFLNEHSVLIQWEDLETAAQCRNAKWLEILTRNYPLFKQEVQYFSDFTEDEEDNSLVFDADTGDFYRPLEEDHVELDFEEILSNDFLMSKSMYPQIAPEPPVNHQEVIDAMVMGGNTSVDEIKKYSEMHNVLPSIEKVGRGDLVLWLKSRVPWELMPSTLDLIILDGLVDDWKQIEDYTPSQDVINEVCGRGHLSMLEDLYHGFGLLPDERGADNAAANGHIKILRWLSILNIEASSSGLHRAITNKKESVIFYILQGKPFVEVEHVTGLVEIGLISALDFIAASDSDFWKTLATAALQSDSISSLVWLHQTKQLLPTQGDIDTHFMRISLPTVKWLTSHHLYPSHAAMSKCKNYATVNWLFTQYPLHYVATTAGAYVKHGVEYLCSSATTSFTSEFHFQISKSFNYALLKNMH